MQSQSSESRVCRKCGEIKPLSLFAGGHKTKSCKACVARYERERQARHRVPKPPKTRPTEKRCLTCGTDQPISAFHRSQIHKGVEYHAARCRTCTATKRNAEYVHKPSRKLDLTITERRCAACHSLKPLDQFPKDPGAPLGHTYKCRICVNAALRAARESNPAAYREVRRRDYQQHRNRRLATSRKWRAANKVRIAAKRSQKYDQNPDPVINRVRDWQQRNRQRVAEHRRKRKALKVAAGDRALSRRQWQELLVLFDHRCAYCWQRPRRMHIDHVYPLSRGGAHLAENVVPACSRCNHRKYNKTLIEYLLVRNLLPFTIPPAC